MDQRRRAGMVRSRENIDDLHSRLVRPRLARNFSELAHSVDKLARGEDGLAAAGGGFVVRPRMADGMEAAHEILAPRQFDLQRHNREIVNLQNRVQTAPHAQGQVFGPTDIDGLLNDFHQRTAYQKLIYSSWDRAETDVQTMHQRWAAEDWIVARQQFMESLGHRTQKWNMDVWEGAGGGGQGHGQGQRQGQQMVVVGANPRGAAQKKLFGHKLTAMAERHAKVVRAAMLAGQQARDVPIRGVSGPGAGAAALANNLAAVISDSIQQRWAAHDDSNDDDMNQQELVCYKDVVRMLAEIVGESSDGGRVPSPGMHSPICFLEADVGPEAVRRTRRVLTLGAKRHLEMQQYEEWSLEMDEAVRGGRLRITESSANESWQQRIRTFVGFKYHMNNFAVPLDAAYSPRPAMISEAQQVKVPAWAFIYHCLRVGELDGAIAEMERCRAAGIQIGDAPLHAVSCMKRLVTPGSTELNVVERRELYEAMYRCQSLFQAEYDKPTDLRQAEARDVYKALVLNMLSIGSDAEVMSELLYDMLGSTFQIEDFLWASLWFVIWSNVAGLEDAVHGGMAQGVGNLRAKGEEALYQQIVSMGGADYFNESNCFVYCKVLLCCQRYGEAILHLWRQRKALAAVHLTVICLHYGLVLPHRPLSFVPWCGVGDGQIIRRAGGGAMSTDGGGHLNDPTPAAVLRVYTAAPFLLDYPEETVDYLVALNSQWQMPLQGVPEHVFNAERLQFEAMKTRELSSLLTAVGRDQLTRLVGSLVEDASAREGQGRTQQGYLDLYMDQSDVNFLLAKAAYHLLTQARDCKGAVHLYQLAGRFEDAMDEMISQLGLVMVPPNPNREYWIADCRRFFERVLGGRLHVPAAPLVHRLGGRGAGGRTDQLVATMEVMLHLCGVVDAVLERRFRDALVTLEAMGILFDDNLIRAYNSDCHQALKQAFDPLLLLAMECTQQLFLEFKVMSTGAGALPHNMNQMLRDMQLKARDIGRFANAISPHLQPHTLKTVNKAMHNI